jgi:glycosyltransferase involved in cell wall biosynthesis
MRILFFATYPTQPTGYARIGNILTNYLAEIGHEVHYLGISNFKNSAIARDIHPFIQLIDALEVRPADSHELYGVDIICEQVKAIQPDLVIIYNDVIVINRLLNEFINTRIVKNFKLCIYLDLVYEYQRLLYFQNIQAWADQVLVFSECWQQNLLRLGFTSEKIAVLPHGYDATLFHALDSTAAAKQAFGFAPDDFIFLNTNRNAYRKAHDITIEAFILCLQKNAYDPKLKLFLNLLTTSPQGYNILELIKVICLKTAADYETVVTKHIFIRPSDLYLTDEKLNLLYNACDVGLNTCLGEGFGLCNLEHACLGKPQIISRVGALADIFRADYATLIAPKTSLYLSPLTEDHQGYTHICAAEDFAAAMDQYYHAPQLAAAHGKLAQEILREKYKWSEILKGLPALLFNDTINIINL